LEEILERRWFIKNYQNDLTRRGKIIKDYKFYDEREWRYVPSTTSELSIILSTQFYAIEANKREYNRIAAKHILKFKPMDISYIILKEENEIPGFIDFLKKSFKKSTLEEVDILTTRILTVDQITHDF
jgi:hypothetical protein